MDLLTSLRNMRNNAHRKAPKKENRPETQVSTSSPKAEKPANKVGKILKISGIWLYRLRKVFMAIPVLYMAFRMAFYNMANLPEQVGLNLQVTGEYAQLIDRQVAVYGPLGITLGCLLIMFCSRRALQPWVISIFTLILPVFLLLTNLYPQ